MNLSLNEQIGWVTNDYPLVLDVPDGGTNDCALYVLPATFPRFFSVCCTYQFPGGHLAEWENLNVSMATEFF